MTLKTLCLNFTLLLLAQIGCATLAQAELSSPWGEAHKTRARILAGEVEGRALAFVEIELAEGWKTYWRNPGEAGLPPAFDWTGSQNVAQATVLYPAPRRMTDQSGDTIGYDGGVIFPVEIVPSDAALPVNLVLTLHYGICKEVCVPVDTTLELAIPSQGIGSPDALAVAALEAVPRPHARARPNDPVLVEAQVELEGAKPRIVITAKFPGDRARADVFLDAPGGVFVPHPVLARDLGDGHLVFEALLDQGIDIDGLRGKSIVATLVGADGAAEATIDLK